MARTVVRALPRCASLCAPLCAALTAAPVGCGDGSVHLGGTDGDSASPDSAAPDSAIPHLGDAPDTGGDPDGMPTAPGLVTLDCPTPPAIDGKVPCTLRLEGPDGDVIFDGPAGVGLHGRSSSGFPKPQFAIELRDAAGDDFPVDLFGMGAEADWILNGMWIDRALFRNKITFDLFRELTGGAEWAPESTYVEMTYQGAYYGVFQLEERVEHGHGRVPVPDDDGTGTNFLVRADESGIPSALQYASWALVYPAESAQTPAVVAGVTARLGRIEAAVARSDATTWDEVDLDSAVAFVLIEEAIKNNDAFYLSHNLYTGADGKARFTPWDVDLSMGQPSYNDNENPASWLAYTPALEADLGRAPGFQDRMDAMWATWRAGALSDDAIDARMAAIPAFLGPAVDRNFERWPIGDVDFGGTLYPVSSYADELAHVATFVHARLAWMDANVHTWSVR